MPVIVGQLSFSWKEKSGPNRQLQDSLFFSLFLSLLICTWDGDRSSFWGRWVGGVTQQLSNSAVCTRRWTYTKYQSWLRARVQRANMNWRCGWNMKRIGKLMLRRAKWIKTNRAEWFFFRFSFRKNLLTVREITSSFFFGSRSLLASCWFQSRVTNGQRDACWAFVLRASLVHLYYYVVGVQNARHVRSLRADASHWCWKR